jgi:hypothetical protein
MESDNSTPTPEKAVAPNAPALIHYERLSEDKFFEGYANNVVFESSAWDLRFIFGKLDQSMGSNANTVIQHAAITLPWSQVKAGLYFLQLHLAVHELINGKVNVPKGVVPLPKPPTEDQLKTLEHANEVFELARELFKRFSEANPEAF